jgi:apolipoprotein N-acyltransferase
MLQYLDDIDDLIGTFGLLYEGLRRLALVFAALVICLVCIVSGAVLALAHPPVALATCILLLVTLLYRSITSPPREQLRSI